MGELQGTYFDFERALVVFSDNSKSFKTYASILWELQSCREEKIRDWSLVLENRSKDARDVSLCNKLQL